MRTSRFAALATPQVNLAPALSPSSMEDYLATLANPRWGDPGQASILLDGVLNGQATTYLALENDPESQGQTIYNNAISGYYGPIGPYAAPPPPTQDELNTYASRHATILLATARNYPNSSGAGDIACAVGLEQGNLNQLHLWGAGDPTGTTQWVDATYATFTLTGAQANDFWNETVAYQQSVNATLAQVTDGIASGTITSYSQIDNAGWPT